MIADQSDLFAVVIRGHAVVGQGRQVAVGQGGAGDAKGAVLEPLGQGDARHTVTQVGSGEEWPVAAVARGGRDPSVGAQGGEALKRGRRHNHTAGEDHTAA
jgi:hypothetical protein